MSDSTKSGLNTTRLPLVAAVGTGIPSGVASLNVIFMLRAITPTNGCSRMSDVFALLRRLSSLDMSVIAVMLLLLLHVVFDPANGFE